MLDSPYSVTCDFIATNCNSTYEAVDWIDNSIAIFASCNILYIYDVHSVKNIFSTNLHKGNINTVKCANINGKDYVISASFQGEVILWSYEKTLIDNSEELKLKMISKADLGKTGVYKVCYIYNKDTGC